MKKLLLITYALSLFMMGCNESSMSDQTQTTIRRFGEIRVDETAHVFIDYETRVQYLKNYNYNCGFMSILVDENGKPILYEGKPYQPNPEEIKQTFYPSRFVCLSVDRILPDGFLMPIVDKETRVIYLKIYDNGHGFMNIFVDSDGRPILYEGELP